MFLDQVKVMTLDEMPEEILKIILDYVTQAKSDLYNARMISKRYHQLTKDNFNHLIVDKILDSHEQWKKLYQTQPYQKRLRQSNKARQNALQENRVFFSNMRNDLEKLSNPGNPYAQLALFKSHCFFWYQNRIKENEKKRKLVFQNLIPKEKRSKEQGINYLKAASTTNTEALNLLDEFTQNELNSYST